MTDPTATRLVELESRLAFLENLLDQLNEVVISQQNQLDHQAAELRRLTATLNELQVGPGQGDEPGELPPHY